MNDLYCVTYRLHELAAAIDGASIGRDARIAGFTPTREQLSRVAKIRRLLAEACHEAQWLRETVGHVKKASDA